MLQFGKLAIQSTSFPPLELSQDRAAQARQIVLENQTVSPVIGIGIGLDDRSRSVFKKPQKKMKSSITLKVVLVAQERSIS